MANRSVFPSQIDTFIEHYDLQASDITNVQRYQQLKLTANRTPEEDTELANLTATLRSKIVSPEDFNLLQDAITNLETFFRDSVDGYVITKQTEMQTYVDNQTALFDAELNKFQYIGEYNATTQYYVWNVVSYMGEGYLCKTDSIGHTPVGDQNDVYWAKIAQRGIQGIQGDQGLPGVGLNFKGTYNPNTAYIVDDLVQYNGSTYICIADATSIVPTDTNYWEVFISKGSSTTLAYYENSVTLSVDESTVSIGISSYNYLKDVLLVYLDGQFLKKGQDYNINVNGIAIDKLGGGTWLTGQVFDFIVFKSITTDALPTDGAMLMDGSVGLLKLSTQVKDLIQGAIPASEKGAANGVASLDANGQVPDAQIPVGITRDTELTAYTRLGTANTDVNKVKAAELKTDTRSTVLTYTAGILTKVEEKDGANVIKTTNLIYTSGVLTSVEEIADGTTVTTTLNYDVNGNLTDTIKAVV